MNGIEGELPSAEDLKELFEKTDWEFLDGLVLRKQIEVVKGFKPFMFSRQVSYREEGGQFLEYFENWQKETFLQVSDNTEKYLTRKVSLEAIAHLAEVECKRNLANYGKTFDPEKAEDYRREADYWSRVEETVLEAIDIKIQRETRVGI